MQGVQPVSQAREEVPRGAGEVIGDCRWCTTPWKADVQLATGDTIMNSCVAIVSSEEATRSSQDACGDYAAYVAVARRGTPEEGTIVVHT